MILVTGGTGFLGAYIIKELVEKGETVRAIRRGKTLPFFIPPAIFEKVEWIQCDLFDMIGLEEAFEGVDAVIHAAASVSFSGKDRRELLHTNIEGTTNIVNMALACDIRRFVHVSSVAALGRTANGEQVNEEKKWTESKLNTSYAISKFYGEMEVWRAIGEGLPAVIVNPSTLLGYGDWTASSAAIFRTVFQESPWYTEGVNGFVDVKDVARAIVQLLESDIAGERYILNGDNLTFHRLFDQIAAAFEKKLPTRMASPFLAAFAWRMEKIKSLFSGRPSLLSRESSRIFLSKTFFDNSKFRQKFPGFVFTPLDHTIREACQAYLLREGSPV